jgi:hypothetical protein
MPFIKSIATIETWKEAPKLMVIKAVITADPIQRDTTRELSAAAVTSKNRILPVAQYSRPVITAKEVCKNFNLFKIASCYSFETTVEIIFFLPQESKSTVRTVISPLEFTSATVPLPNFLWFTLSPGANV